MKKLLLIESDTNYYSLFAYELVATDEPGVYQRVQRPGTEPFIKWNFNDSQFFGAIRAALTTAQDLEKAKPIELVKP